MRKLIVVAAIVPLLAVISCEKDNGSMNVEVPGNVIDAFGRKYPGVDNVLWSSKGSYWVASFNAPVKSTGYDSSAWFDNSGKWWMTETDYTMDNLPEAVVTAFRASEYALWTVDDVDVIFRDGAETVFVIEVETLQDGKELEYGLYYLEDGTLMKTVPDGDDDYDYEDFIPAQLPDAVKSYLDEKYPEAKLLEVDMEKNGAVEVEILDGKTVKDLFFDSKGAWVSTEWDVLIADLPEAVQNTIRNEAQDWDVEDITYTESATGNWYEVEIENDADREKTLKVAPDGTLIK